MIELKTPTGEPTNLFALKINKDARNIQVRFGKYVTYVREFSLVVISIRITDKSYETKLPEDKFQAIAAFSERKSSWIDKTLPPAEYYNQDHYYRSLLKLNGVSFNDQDEPKIIFKILVLQKVDAGSYVTVK